MKRTIDRSLKQALVSSYWRESEAQAVLSAWSASGLSLGAFAADHGLSRSRLERWKSRLRSRGSAMAFHRVEVSGPISVAASTAGIGSVDVMLRGGRRVRVRPGFDAALLTAVVRAVESWPC